MCLHRQVAQDPSDGQGETEGLPSLYMGGGDPHDSTGLSDSDH